MAKYRRKRYYQYPKRRRKKQMISDNVFVAILIAFLVVFFIWQRTGFDVQSMLTVLAVVFILLVSLIFSWVWWQNHQRHKQMMALTTSGVKQLSGIEFEHYLGELLKEAGYKQVEVTPPQGDYGADLFAEKDGISYAIQAKQYADHNYVGVHAVQEIGFAKEFYDKDKAIVITTGYFSDNAKKAAKKNGIMLIDKSKLSAMIEQHSKQNS